MSDDNTTVVTPDPAVDGWKAPASQDELNRIVQSRLERERAKFADYDDLKAKAAEFDKLSEASKTELQKAIERAEKAESERLALLRDSVGLAKGLTPTQAKRLVGATREELEADADELLKDLGPSGAPRAPQTKKSTTAHATGSDEERAFVRQLFKREA